MVNLSSEIQALINKVKKLKHREPTNTKLISQYDDLEKLLEEAQDKEWNENHDGYLVAKKELETANAAAQKYLDDLSDLANTIEMTATAIDKIVAAFAAAAP